MAKPEQVIGYMVQHSLGNEKTPVLFIEKDTRAVNALVGAIGVLAVAKWFHLVLMVNGQLGFIPVSGLGTLQDEFKVLDPRRITKYKPGSHSDYMSVDFGGDTKPMKLRIRHGGLVRYNKDIELLRQLVAIHGIPAK
ncbi:MAG: hypothetical protein FWF33_05280 [Clostridiales bacterium]|nr:hypothetical protein [Clostridiales bacterium]